jgi:branched-chain amino acid transport system permease protein
MAYFLQQLINGLTLGSIYGLIAIGYTMVYGIIGMINFAHGEIYMIGAFISIIAFLVLGLAGITYIPLALALVLLTTMLFTAIYGWAVERVAYRPLRGSFRLAPLISAIGTSIFLQNYVQIVQGARAKPMPPMVQGGFTVFESGGFAVRLSYLQVLIILTTLVLMAGFSSLIASTSLGRAQRACEQDMRMAALLGIDVDRVISTTFVMGAALAALHGAWHGSELEAAAGSAACRQRPPGLGRNRYCVPGSPRNNVDRPIGVLVRLFSVEYRTSLLRGPDTRACRHGAIGGPIWKRYDDRGPGLATELGATGPDWAAYLKTRFYALVTHPGLP